VAERGRAAATACSTAASAGPVEQGHHRQRLWMLASPPVAGAGATPAATATLLQEAAMAAAPGEIPASTAAGGRPAEDHEQAQARSSTGTICAASAVAGRQPCCC
jgi:hypothetical protein